MVDDRSMYTVVQRFPGLRALVIGDVMIDTYLQGTATRLCKEGPAPVVVRESVSHAPGGAANTAANLAALGAEVTVIGVIGADGHGALLGEELARHGVQSHGLIEDREICTIQKTRVVADGHYVVRFDEGGSSDFSAATRRALIERIRRELPVADLVVISDYEHGVLSAEILAAIADLRAVGPRVLAVDAKDLTRYRDFPASVVTPNLAEAQRAATAMQLPIGKAGAPGEAVARQLHEVLNAEIVAVTLAGDGVALMRGAAGFTHLPTHPVAHAGDVGAGDTFIAALSLALAADAEPVLAAKIGLEAASIAVTKRQTAVVEHRELLRRITLSGQPASIEVSELAARLDRERWDGKTIVFTNGVFDILHAGHVQLLQRARQLGDILVVGVNSDASTRRLKGPARPINRESDRLALVQALEPVDFALLFEDDTPVDLIRMLRPDIHVKGGDYTPDSLPERAAVEEVGGRIEILSLVQDRSTTNVINRIVELVAAGQVG